MSIWTILLALLIFSVIIMIHELGHFAAAKAFGVKVEEFSIGMGPALLHFQGKETRYSLRAIPMGGYVQMEGEDSESQDPRAFCRQKAWKRFVIVSAGAVMNLLLGFVVAVAMVSMKGYVGTAQIVRFEENAQSSQVLQQGDEILSINGSRIFIDQDIVYTLVRDEDGLVDMTVLRQGEKLQLQVPFATQTLSDGTHVVVLDFKVLATPQTFFNTIRYGIGWNISVARQVWMTLFDLITGRYGLNQLSGPVGTTQAIGQASSYGLGSLLMIVGFITVNLGVFNLLPFPALDGGRLLFLVVEMIRRRPVPARYEGYVHAAGFLLLMALMVTVTYQAIMRLIAS